MRTKTVSAFVIQPKAISISCTTAKRIAVRANATKICIFIPTIVSARRAILDFATGAMNHHVLAALSVVTVACVGCRVELTVMFGGVALVATLTIRIDITTAVGILLSIIINIVD